MSSKSWILYGPQGCGKTRDAKAIADSLGLEYVHDEWDGTPESFEPWHTLHITNVVPEWARHLRRIISYEEAMKRR